VKGSRVENLCEDSGAGMADLSAIVVDAVVKLDSQRNGPYDKRNNRKQDHNSLLPLLPEVNFLYSLAIQAASCPLTLVLYQGGTASGA
jgi:hypothetical protein